MNNWFSAWKFDVMMFLGGAASTIMYALENYGGMFIFLITTLITTIFAIRKHVLEEKYMREEHEQRLRNVEKRHEQEMEQDRQEFKEIGKNKK